MKPRNLLGLVIVSCALGVLDLFATSRGVPASAQARSESFDPHLSAPAPVMSTATTVRFAVIGDYGNGYYTPTNESAVAALVNSWNPDFVITVGDNNYDQGLTSTIDANIGQFYSNYIYPYTGTFSSTAITNRFFPALGNHDWGNAYPNPAGANPYLAYFTLPGNERYYDFVWGPAQFFALDSDLNELDGITPTSRQAAWLERKLAYSTAKWRVVYFHHAPYTSGTGHASTTELQWPFQSWGATAVLAGHVHNYERIVKNNFPYFVNGLGGKSIYPSGAPIAGSVFQYSAGYGAMLVTADDSMIVFKFHSITDTVHALDTYTVTMPSTSIRGYFPLIKR